MAFKKSHLFPPEDQQISLYGQAISHPVRVDILKTLKKMPGASVERLSQNLPLARSTVSGHLRLLRKAHLVTFREQFPHTYYTLNQKEINALKRKMKLFLAGF